MKHHLIVISELKTASILGVGSILNFFAAFDPVRMNAWVGLLCGVLALIIALPKCFDALLKLRVKSKAIVRALINDITTKRK